MEKMLFGKIFLITLLYLEFSFSQDIVLNTPKVLLPYVAKRSSPTTYVLKALKGCFKWSSSKSDVAVVSHIDEKTNKKVAEDVEDPPCSSSALITVTQKSPDKDSTVIIAEEEGTGLLRCDIFVDSISHIEIATTTRELLLGESPEVFEVHAYDKEGNLFTALGSQTFEWTFSPVRYKGSSQEPRNILRSLWFQDSQYETTPEIYGLEEQRVRGSAILIEGIHTGETLVTAKLTNSDYKNVKPSKVTVVVIDNIMLVPSLSYILTQQKISYKAFQLRRGARNDIILPSRQYTINVVNSTVLKLQSQDASVYGFKLGVTKVQLIDNNMADASTVKRPSATVHVVEAEKIGFAINPGKVWVLQTSKQYEMHVQLFDDENNKIVVTDDTVFQSSLRSEYFDIHKRSANGSYFFVTAKKEGKTILASNLKEIKTSTGKSFKVKELYGKQTIEIYDPLILTPELAVFPWDPNTNGTQGYSYQLRAAGGSGSYLWQSKNNSFCSVNKKGIITAATTIGSADVKVIDAKNPNANAKATVKVLPPEELHFVSRHREVAVGSVVKLPISLAAFVDEEKKERIVFSDCRKLDILITFQDSSILSHEDQDIQDKLPSQGCTTIVLKGVKVGSTMVTAVYQYDSIILQDFIYIATYNPVKVVDPVKFATVALGSKKRIVAEGGPLPWVLDPSQHYEVMSAEEEDWVKIIQARKVKDVGEHNSLHYFDVTCTVLGEQLLTIEIGNKPTTSLRQPAVSSAKTKFSCVQPSTILLSPSIRLPLIDGTKKTLESCKDDHKRIPVRNERDLKVRLLVFDKNGNEFDDASSLTIDWRTDQTKVGYFLEKQTRYEEVLFDKNGAKKGGSQIFNILHLSDVLGSLILTATVTSLYNGIKKVPIESSISTDLHIITLPVAQVTPNDLNLYAHPSNVVDLNVKHGTGHFVLKANDDTLSKIKFIAPNKIILTPQRSGSLVLKLHDACLDAEEPSTVNVGFHDADGIILSVKDKVEVGHSIEAKCIATSADQRELKVDARSQLKLSLKMATKILDIKNMTTSSKTKLLMGVGEMFYNVTGMIVGVTSLYCHATKLSGMELTSVHKEVQVFSAIKFEPKHILLIVGSVFQIHSQGGPRPHSTAFTIDNKTVADVSSAGLITARVIGKTRVVGRAKGMESGNEIVYSSDEIIVEVIQIQGFKIDFKSRNIISDSKVGILAVGINNEGPFTFASSPPYLKFHWSSSNHKIALVESVHAEAGVSVSTDKDFRAVVKTSNPGQAAIKLRVEIMSNDFSQATTNVKLQDEVQIQVYEQLKLIEPESGKLLLPPNVNTRIKTNRDHISRVTYEMLTPCAKDGVTRVIQVSSTGHITSYSSSGSATVLVTVHEEFGFNQTALVEVEVKPVASITLISTSNFVVINKDRPSFPIGSNVVFRVTLHDNVGRKFDIASIGVQHRASRDDVVDILPNIESATFTLRATSVGETILKVWDKENVAISDYVRIKVTEGVFPTRISVPLGSLLCFSTAVSTGEGWWSVSGKPLSIIKESGVGTAVAVGSTMVFYNEEGFNTYTEVTVTTPNIDPSIIEDENYLFLTNGQSSKHFYISLEGSENRRKCDQSSITPNDLLVPFTCEATWLENDGALGIDSVFNLEPAYIKGRPSCAFTTRNLSPERLKAVSGIDRTLTLSVSLTDQNSHIEYNSHRSSHIRFIPDVFITTKKMTLGRNQMSDSVDVCGSESQLGVLKVSSDSALIRLGKIDVGENSRHRYQMSVTEVPSMDVNVSIKFYSSITKVSQYVTVNIKGLSTGAQCLPKLSSQSWSGSSSFSIRRVMSYVIGDSGAVVAAYTVMIATIILILFLYHFYVKEKQATPVVIHSPYTHHTPGHSPPPYQYNLSYQSPPPANTTPGSYGPNKQTPTRLFSVTQ